MLCKALKHLRIILNCHQILATKKESKQKRNCNRTAAGLFCKPVCLWVLGSKQDSKEGQVPRQGHCQVLNYISQVPRGQNTSHFNYIYSDHIHSLFLLIMYNVLILLHYHKLACTIDNGLHLNNWRTGNCYAIITNISSRVLIDSTQLHKLWCEFDGWWCFPSASW